MKKQVIIHVGLPKTASTYLQDMFFPFLKDVYFCYRNVKTNNDPLQEYNRKLRNYFPVDVSQEKNAIYEYINNLHESNIILSDEIFSTNCEYYTDYLKPIFPDAKIILCVREQTDWLESLYKHHITTGKSNIVVDYFLKLNAFNCNWLDKYKHYVNNFGKENVLVLPYEMFKKDKSQFFKMFFEFTGIEYFYPENKLVRSAPSFSSLILKSLIYNPANIQHNKFIQLLIKFLDNFIKIKGDFIDKKRKGLIKSYYSNFNKELSEHIGIDLKKYGYIAEELTLGDIKLQNNIDKLAKKYKNKKVLIYGAGKFFQTVTENLDLKGLNIIGVSDRKFCNSDVKDFAGYKVIDLSEIQNHDFDVIILGVITEVKTVTRIKEFLEDLLGANKFKLDFIHNYTFMDRIKILISN
ncbi:MAG TPA: sulfotransferase [Candidatus Gastranaerophilales bacterium]|nr:sulfotransferase [Candidatus Gastranaerophilales bacterium]